MRSGIRDWVTWWCVAPAIWSTRTAGVKEILCRCGPSGPNTPRTVYRLCRGCNVDVGVPRLGTSIFPKFQLLWYPAHISTATRCGEAPAPVALFACAYGTCMRWLVRPAEGGHTSNNKADARCAPMRLGGYTPLCRACTCIGELEYLSHVVVLQHHTSCQHPAACTMYMHVCNMSYHMNECVVAGQFS